MDSRLGVCTACRSRFKIPATFRPNQARCRQCGGTVRIGPPGGGEPAEPERAQPAQTTRREQRERLTEREPRGPLERGVPSPSPPASPARVVEPGPALPSRASVREAPPSVNPPPVAPQIGETPALVAIVQPELARSRARNRKSLAALVIVAVAAGLLAWWLWARSGAHGRVIGGAPAGGSSGASGPHPDRD